MAERNKQEPLQFKIFIVGDAQVGKTYVVNKIIQKSRNSTKYKPTYGFNYHIWEHEIHENRHVVFQLWDTAGQEKYRGITKEHYKSGVGAIIVYDITKEDSFCNVKNWIEEIKSNCIEQEEEDPYIIVIGNKKDLKSQRKVGYEEAYQIVKKEDKDIDIFEISTVSADPVDTSYFEKVINHFFKKIYERLKKRGILSDNDPNIRLADTQVQTSKSCCCC
ncbi:transmembrane protein, putative (macronuclear) [Tetrahymena thermophila SB210]|uniref:Transmembrane protein, putative n=1 Tax=Tetrahymena thermophila (strain SB210) TaxID=312017 RepID=Q22HF1_TETTS|nr:transmembrane protein, putative [Tetrahymena thermophila SB210]EAR84750.2 transmembrane protein, putative [Tetrahymena thermophila SB210]|eukprot:XP_001032413.2 transmembrane protein, putative [Tetrahymena thermophila SB210]